MSIGSFVSGSLTILDTNKCFDVALSLACSAVDATSKKMFPKDNNNERFKKFIREYMRVISFRGFPGIVASGIKIKCINIKGLKVDANGMVGIEDIIYHIIRCGIIHECEIDKRIVFTENTYIGDFHSIFRIPKDLVYGLLLAVILSKYNEEEKTDDGIMINISGQSIEVNKLWGKIREFSADL